MTRSDHKAKRPRPYAAAGFNSRAHIIGVVVSETASDTRIAAESEIANSRNSRPTMPPIRRIGMNTAISDRLIDTTVKPTSRAPFSAASRGAIPPSIWRETFSSTTIASSTTNPVAIVSAISERLLRLNPQRYMTPNVPINDTGTATLGISAARALRRNRNTTRITSDTAMISVRSTSRSDARIDGVRSIITCMSIASGIEARSCGSTSRTRSSVSMMFAFGCLFRISSIDGLPLALPSLRRSCTESTTCATSPSRTAALSRYATINGMYSAAVSA